MKHMEYLGQLLGLSAVTMAGWLHIRQGRLEEQIQSCVKKDSFEELRRDMKVTLELVTELRVENARWQGLVERVIENNSNQS